MLLLGIDLGTSSIKVSVIDASTQLCLATCQYPEKEVDIISLRPGWAEQSPNQWWEHIKRAILKCNATGLYNPKNIAAIGIAYQMHGLVLVDKDQKVLRNSIIWCDSRAVDIGEAAANDLGEEICSSCLLNSPGNFTAAKLAWVKKNEPEVYTLIYKVMLPGDFIAMKLSGQITTTASALSEGIFWDFKKDELSKDVMNQFDFDENIIPSVQAVFSEHGRLTTNVADELSLQEKIPITYKAGDQLNNALSLNVFQPGEVAATAGTSGVIYAVTDKLKADKHSRVNTFAHVNHAALHKRLGILLCINGTGIMNSWVKKITGDLSYQIMDDEAGKIEAGSDGLFVLPFGNGAERMFRNTLIGAQLNNIDLNKHSRAHIFRATQEGIAFAFRYGLDILKENGLQPTIIRAGKANLFQSRLFVQSFVDTTGVTVELYANDGSAGAAIGAGIGVGIFSSTSEGFGNFKPLLTVQPIQEKWHDDLYHAWKLYLDSYLN